MTSKTPFPGLSVEPRNQTLSMLHAIYAGLLAFTLVIFVYLEYQQSMSTAVELAGLVVLLLILFVLNLKASRDVKQGQNKGLWLSRILAILMLPGFPIGSVLGLIALWKTTAKQWQV